MLKRLKAEEKLKKKQKLSTINNSKMELQGKVIVVCEPRSGVSKSTGNAWMTQDYVIETHEQFPKRMMFNVFGEDKIKQFNIQMGEEINVFFDINAREYQGKYYNDIRAWRIDRVQPGQPAPADNAANFPPMPNTPPAQPAAPQQMAGAAPQQPDFKQSEPEDDLPF